MYTDPKIDWNIEYEPSPPDMNRIEQNIKHIKDEDGTINGDKNFTGDNSFTGANTISGNTTISGAIQLDINMNGKNLEAINSLLSRPATAIIEPAAFLNGSGTVATIYNKLSSLIPVIGNQMLISGIIRVGAGYITCISRAERTTAAIIVLYGFNIASGVALNTQIYAALTTAATYDLSWW